MTTIKRIVFIRPGETDWNRLGRWQGQVAIPLNEYGRAQAERLAFFVRPLGISMLYSSDLRRARNTVEPLALECKTHPIFDARLRERHMGEWQGLTLDEIKSWYSEEYARLRANPFGYQIPGGESRQQVVDRVRAAMTDILGRGGSETVGVVTHTTVIMTILSELVPDCGAFDMEFSNISVTTLTNLDGSSWKITQLNDVSHLVGMDTLKIGGLSEDELETISGA